ncbi:hypothetical protein JCM16814_29200 [Desulfobaculum senezii]|jgi:hypothetical protein
MAILDMNYLEKLEAYLTSGDLAFDFENADEEQRYAILEFLEKLMDVADEANEQATKLIFKDGYLEALAGVKPQK